MQRTLLGVMVASLVFLFTTVTFLNLPGETQAQVLRCLRDYVIPSALFLIIIGAGALIFLSPPGTESLMASLLMAGVLLTGALVTLYLMQIPGAPGMFDVLRTARH